MKGIVLAGGTGSRLYPLTKVTNKHLLPIGDKPMIYYPIEKLTEVGIDEILIVTGTEHMGDVVTLLGSGAEFGCKFTYKVQDEAGGIAQALSLAENFAGDEPILVILGDNIFYGYNDEFVNTYPGSGAKLLLQQVEDPERFGVAEVSGNKISGIEEKPDEPKSDYAVTGIYLYDTSVFDYIRELEPSERGEYEITDVNNRYIQKGAMRFSVLPGWWTDAGTPISYRKANNLVFKKSDKK